MLANDKLQTNTLLFPSGLQHQGIFRVSGSQVEVNDIKNSFERGETVTWRSHGPQPPVGRDMVYLVLSVFQVTTLWLTRRATMISILWLGCWSSTSGVWRTRCFQRKGSMTSSPASVSTTAWNQEHVCLQFSGICLACGHYAALPEKLTISSVASRVSLFSHHCGRFTIE